VAELNGTHGVRHVEPTTSTELRRLGCIRRH
jgi:hypothetical protein